MSHLVMTDETFLEVLDQASRAIEGIDVPHALIGGIASVVHGRPRWTRSREDIDFFVRFEDSHDVLEALAAAGFETEETNDQWIYKAVKDDVQVDIIFRSSGDMYLDDEMLQRIRSEEFQGHKVRVVAPEDLLVMKVVAHGEETFHYWHDALGLVARGDLDWDYLVWRARRHGTRRVLSLMLYAQSIDLVVPSRVIEDLYETIHRAS
jgi:predicted nucleotidyltransferase